MKPVPSLLPFFALLFLLHFSFATENFSPSNSSKTVSDLSRSETTTYDFPGWTRKQAITINSALINGTADLTNFPVLITLAHLNTEVVDDGANSALNGGGDLRFSSDAAGNNRLAVEVVQFTTSGTAANRRCQVWVKIPSLSATSNTTIYVWYHKAGEVQPAANDTFGSQAVWSDYEAIWHMENDPSGTAPQIADATGNGHNLSSAGGMTSGNVVGGAIGNAIAFDGANDHLSLATNAIINNGNFTISSYVNWSGTNGFNAIVGNSNPWSGLWVHSGSGGRTVFYDGITQRFSGGNTVTPNTIVKVDYTVENGNSQHFFNGNPDVANTQTIASSNFRFVGSESTGAGFFSGWIDEIRVSKVFRNASWLSTEYSNHSNPGAFATKGAAQDGSSGGTGGTTGSGSGYWVQNGNDINYESGNVGIGTTSPNAKLDINGSIRAKETITVNTDGSYKVAMNGQSDGYIAGRDNSFVQQFLLRSNGVSFLNGGNVGIGTNTPDAKLTVKGRIHTEEVKVDLSVPAPDYVFKSDYNLITLPEIQEYIVQYGHLPNIPSAEEMEKNGIDLGTINMKLLEKIEELTLYILEQDRVQKLQNQKQQQLEKRIEQLENRN